jgi:hypothetical protein
MNRTASLIQSALQPGWIGSREQDDARMTMGQPVKAGTLRAILRAQDALAARVWRKTYMARVRSLTRAYRTIGRHLQPAPVKREAWTQLDHLRGFKAKPKNRAEQLERRYASYVADRMATVSLMAHKSDNEGRSIAESDLLVNGTDVRAAEAWRPSWIASLVSDPDVTNDVTTYTDATRATVQAGTREQRLAQLRREQPDMFARQQERQEQRERKQTPRKTAKQESRDRALAIAGTIRMAEQD